MFSGEIFQIFKNIFFIERFRWLLLEGFCEGTRLVKILQFCHFNRGGKPGGQGVMAPHFFAKQNLKRVEL